MAPDRDYRLSNARWGYTRGEECSRNHNYPNFQWGAAVAEHSKYQQKIIKNYYQNQDAILLQRLGEQITELFLAEGKARAKRWKDVAKVLEKLKVPATRIENVLKKDDPALVAKLLEELLAKQK
jgi:hypothetical protein